jgi:hypothetical protein
MYVPSGIIVAFTAVAAVHHRSAMRADQATST